MALASFLVDRGVFTDLTERTVVAGQVPSLADAQGAFCLNYVSSFFGLSTVIFFPMMIGCSVMLAWKYGGLLFIAPLLTLAFFAMVTALTYQFRGWLAALMKNKRRRRFILTVLTLGIILISQIPNILDQTLFRAREEENRQAQVDENVERASLDVSFKRAK
jgi:hypothetical protein